MAHYITSSLEEGEHVVLRGRLHWVSVFRYIASALLLMAAGIGVAVWGYLSQRTEMYIVAGGLGIVGILTYLLGCFVRTKCEFAVTTSRFIQKDGIFNIKMTEIPLFKIETVNFYQSLGQRMIGTGSIEFVGSGGTCHRVIDIEQPQLVRKTVVKAINKKENES